MKKGLTVLFLISVVVVQAQFLTSYQYIRSYTIAQVDSLILANGIPASLLDIEYEVDAYKVVYQTVHPQTGPITASGAILVPRNAVCGLPVASYQHGTVFHKENVPSRLDDNSELVGILFAATGYYVQMPDFIGLGDSPGMHPYIHADSEADAVIDMLRASYELLDTFHVQVSDELFLYGYSQGGHVTMAAHKKIQEQFSDEFTVTASAPLSGPYDVSGIQAEVITSHNPYPAPEYLPYVIFGLQDAYGSLFHSPSEVFLPPWDTLLPAMFDGQHTSDQISSVLPAVPNQILLPDVLEDFTNNPKNPIRQALEWNDVYDWAPVSPMHMVYCESDMHVSYLNATFTLDTMLALGATEVEALSAGSGHDHHSCAFYAFLSTNYFFDLHRHLNNNMQISTNILHESTPGASDGSIANTVTGSTAPFTYSWLHGPFTPDVAGLNAGVYVLTVTDAVGCSETHLFTVGVASGITDENTAPSLFLAPHPGKEKVQLQSKSSIRACILHDAQGRLVQQVETDGGTSVVLHRSGLLAGIYFLELITDDRHFYQKLIWK